MAVTQGKLYFGEALVFVAEVLIIAAVMLLIHFYNGPEPPSTSSITGWAAVLGSVLIYGCFSIPMKTPALKDIDLDPAVYQMYYSAAAGLACMLVAIYARPVVFSPWGILGAAIWVGSAIPSFVAISAIGMAQGPAIWAGLTVLVSFLWGLVVFREEVRSLPLAVLGVVVIIAGIFGVSMCEQRFFSRLLGRAPPDSEATPLVMEGGGEQTRSSKPEVVADSAATAKRRITGVCAALLVGLLNGSLMVPFHYYMEDMKHTDGSKDSISIGYLFSFGIGILIVTLPMCGAVLLTRCRRPQLHPRTVLVPGAMTGIFWAGGTWCATYSTLYLGDTVGYPLTQTCIVIASLWGIVFFKEIRGAEPIMTFALATVVVLGGCILLALFGKK